MATNALYKRFKSAASGLLKKMGAPATVTSRENGTLEGYAVFMKSNTEANGGDDTNSKTVYFQGSDEDPAPAPGDLVTLNGENWGITSVEDYNPDGSLTIMFKMQVAR